MAPTLPFLTKFRHKQEGLSADEGTGQESSFPPESGFNTLLDDISHQQMIGYRPEGQNIGPITTTSYPGTPDMRFPLTPWVGRYLFVQAMMAVTTGAASFDLKVEVEAPVSTKVNVFNLSHSGAEGLEQSTYDLSSVSGVDVRGMDGWLNIYFKMSSGGSIGVLTGFTAWQGETRSSNSYKLLG